MNKRAKIMVVKYVTYSLLMLILYVLQSTPQLFSIAGINAEGETVIEDSECVDVSYPTFYEQLNSLQ